MIITRTQYYRIQLLQKDGKTTHFIVYRAKGEDPTEYEVNTLHQNIRLLKKLEPFNLLARKDILLALAEAQESISNAELRRLTKQSAITINTEIAYLEERSLVEETDKGKYILVYDIRTFREISQELLASLYKYDFLRSSYFRKMNNKNLAIYCLSRRFLNTENAQEHALLNSLFQYSPAALNQALFGNIERYRTTYEHASQVGGGIQRIADITKSSFYTEMIPHLLTIVSHFFSA